MTLVSITGILYLVSSLFFIFFWKTNSDRILRMGLSLLATGSIIHLIFFVQKYWINQQFPIFHLSAVFSAMSLLLSLSFLLLIFWFPLHSFGVLAAPASFVLLLLALFFYNHDQTVSIFGDMASPLFPLHVSSMVIAESSAVISLVFGVTYLLLERQLKSKKLGFLFQRFPSLDIIDDLYWNFLLISLVSMTGGLILGSFWAKHLWGEYWSWDPRQIWSLTFWIFTVTLVFCRKKFAFRGRKLIMITIIGFSVLFCSHLSIHLLGIGRHLGNYGLER